MLDERFLTVPIAHRGLWNAERPENSLAAVAAAVEAGFGIEIDLQLSADEQAIVFHDDTVDRMTAHKGWVADYGAATLGTFQLLDAQGQTIPTLKQVLEVVDGRVPLLIELKDQSMRPGGSLGPLEVSVASDLENYDGPAAVMSFHPLMVKNLSQVLPGVPRGITGEKFDAEALGDETAEMLNDYALFDETRSCFISHHWRDLAMPAVARLKNRGVPILCWTTRAPAEESFARKIADNVTFERYLPA